MAILTMTCRWSYVSTMCISKLQLRMSIRLETQLGSRGQVIKALVTRTVARSQPEVRMAKRR